MRVIMAILLVSLLNGSQSSAASERSFALKQCGGHLIVESNEMQTVLRLENVANCPYVVFNEDRRSMELTPDGQYSDFYVWHESESLEQLRVVVHNASGEARDEVKIGRPSLSNVSSR